MRITKNTDDPVISRAVTRVALMVADNFESLQVTVGSSDYEEIDAGAAMVSISRDNPFLLDHDEDGIEILVMKRVLALRHDGRLSDISADRELIREGMGKKLFSYYYTLLCEKKEIKSMEEYIEANIPWISFYPHDKGSSEALQEVLGSIKHPKFPQTDNLFSLLKKNLYTQMSISEAQEEWERLCR